MTPQFIAVLRRIAYAIIVIAVLTQATGIVALAAASSFPAYMTLTMWYWPLLFTGTIMLIVAKLAAWRSKLPPAPSSKTARILRRTGLALIFLSPVAMQIAVAGFTAQEPLPFPIDWLAYICFFSWPWLGLSGAVLIVVVSSLTPPPSPTNAS